MARGLSHIVLTASSNELFERTIEFYKAFGFSVINSPNQHEQDTKTKESWLKISADEHSMTFDGIIRLVMKPNAIARDAPSSDLDWSLNESALSFTVADVVVRFISYIDILFFSHHVLVC